MHPYGIVNLFLESYKNGTTCVHRLYALAPVVKNYFKWHFPYVGTCSLIIHIKALVGSYFMNA